MIIIFMLFFYSPEDFNYFAFKNAQKTKWIELNNLNLQKVLANKIDYNLFFRLCYSKPHCYDCKKKCYNKLDYYKINEYNKKYGNSNINKLKNKIFYYIKTYRPIEYEIFLNLNKEILFYYKKQDIKEKIKQIYRDENNRLTVSNNKFILLKYFSFYSILKFMIISKYYCKECKIKIGEVKKIDIEEAKKHILIPYRYSGTYYFYSKKIIYKGKKIKFLLILDAHSSKLIRLIKEEITIK